jgi:hypothetical protein
MGLSLLSATAAVEVAAAEVRAAISLYGRGVRSRIGETKEHNNGAKAEGER